jgi:hypothetical protein
VTSNVESDGRSVVGALFVVPIGICCILLEEKDLSFVAREYVNFMKKLWIKHVVW